MKINFNKIFLIILYIILLIALLGLFSIVHNTQKNPASFPKFASLIIIVSALIVSAFFFIAFRLISKLESQFPGNNKETEYEQAEQNQTREPDQEKTENEFIIDIKNLIPKEKIKIENFAEELLKNIASEFNIVQGLFYIKEPSDDNFKCLGQYAYYSETKPAEFKTGETLPGQAAKNKTIITISNIPDQYMTVVSGLGKSTPRYLTFVPVKTKEDVVGVIEFASFSPVTEPMQKALSQLADKTADIIVKLIRKVI